MRFTTRLSDVLPSYDVRDSRRRRTNDDRKTVATQPTHDGVIVVVNVGVIRSHGRHRFGVRGVIL